MEEEATTLLAFDLGEEGLLQPQDTVVRPFIPSKKAFSPNTSPHTHNGTFLALSCNTQFRCLSGDQNKCV